MYSAKRKITPADHDEPDNFITTIEKQRDPLLGAALTIPSTVVAQIVGSSGHDFVFIDMEHSPLTPETTTQIVHAIVASSRGLTLPVIRVPSHGVEWIKWALDSGAAGIIVPMVNNKAEVDEIVNRATYPPQGSRSFGPARAPWGLPDGPQGGVAEYFRRAKRGDIAILPTIESEEGLANAEDIISSRDVSGVFLGPMDLRLSLGFSGVDGSEPEYLGAIEKICGLGRRYGKIVGSLALSPEAIWKRTQDGMKFLVISSDASTLAAGLATNLERSRQQASEKATSLL